MAAEMLMPRLIAIRFGIGFGWVNGKADRVRISSAAGRSMQKDGPRATI